MNECMIACFSSTVSYKSLNRDFSMSIAPNLGLVLSIHVLLISNDVLNHYER